MPRCAFPEGRPERGGAGTHVVETEAQRIESCLLADVVGQVPGPEREHRIQGVLGLMRRYRLVADPHEVGAVDRRAPALRESGNEHDDAVLAREHRGLREHMPAQCGVAAEHDVDALAESTSGLSGLIASALQEAHRRRLRHRPCVRQQVDGVCRAKGGLEQVGVPLEQDVHA
ncbi:MAG TPA: hypothetical protein VNJ54_10260 [Plantibacter sp.]|nr:hypothetical protein [Plantibacter sp.]